MNNAEDTVLSAREQEVLHAADQAARRGEVLVTPRKRETQAADRLVLRRGLLAERGIRLVAGRHGREVYRPSYVITDAGAAAVERLRAEAWTVPPEADAHA